MLDEFELDIRNCLYLTTNSQNFRSTNGFYQNYDLLVSLRITKL